MESTMSRPRPLGVTIIAILLIIVGIFELLGGGLALAAAFAAGHAIATHGHTTSATVVDVIGSVLGSISLVIGLLTLIFAWGLWALKRWAFWLVIILEAISLLRHAFELIQPHYATWSIVVGMILPAIILIYFLLDANVRRAFRT